MKILAILILFFSLGVNNTVKKEKKIIKTSTVTAFNFKEENSAEERVKHAVTKTFYNSKGLVTRSTYRSSYDDFKGVARSVITYNTNKQETKTIHYKANNEIRGVSLVEYVENEKRSVYFKGNPDSVAMDSYSIWKFNEEGKIITYNTFLSDSSVWFGFTYTYVDGVLDKIADQDRGTYDKYLEYEKGMKVKVGEFDKEDQLVKEITYEYKWDKYDNWINSKRFENGKLVWEEERVLLYH